MIKKSGFIFILLSDSSYFLKFEELFKEEQIIDFEKFCEFLTEVQQNVHDIAKLYHENVSVI